jgi:hypothetical protein
MIGLSVAGAEITIAGYARQPATLAYAADGVTLANTETIAWPAATAAWGVIDGVLLFDATGASLGPPLTVAAPVAIGQYDQARIPAGGIVVTEVTLPRGYGTGGFGTSVYGAYQGLAGTAVVERIWDDRHVCAPGTWTPGPFSYAAAA